MIRTSFLSALLFALSAVAGLSSSAAAQGPGVRVGFDRHGLSEVSLSWNRAPRYARSTPVVRTRYGRDVCTPGPAYVWRVEPVWVPATREKVWVEPVVRVHYDACGRRVETLVKPGHWRIVVTPGRYEERKVKTRVVGRPAVVRRY